MRTILKSAAASAALIATALCAPTVALAGYYYVPTCYWTYNTVWNGFAWVTIQQYVCN